jgi:hypothetical protein
MSSFKSFADESPFLESDVLTAEEIEPRYELRGMESPFFTAELGSSFAELEDAWSEETEEPAPAGSDGVIAFDAQTLPIRVAVLVTQAAREARDVEVLLFAHGLDVCKPVLKDRPVTLITERPFRLGQLVEASGRPIVLVVPFLDWEHLAKNNMSFGRKWHKLAQPKNLNGVIAEAMTKAESVTGTAHSIGRLIVAGHSRAYGIFDAMASLHADPETTSGALAKLTHVWALDSTYSSPVDDWMKWLDSRSGLRMTVIYRSGTSTGAPGNRFRARAKDSGGRMTVRPVSKKVGHCAIPGHYLPELLSSLSGSASTTAEETFYLDEELYAVDEELDAEEQEAEDDFEEGEGAEEPSAESFAAFAEEESEEEEGEEDYEIEAEEESYDSFETETDDEESEDEAFVDEEVLESSGLTPAELKAVQITSTFETGKRGGFYGLSGNFDGYGLSFGLVNWNIGTGSLQPLLRDFAAEQSARWNEIFGPNAASFLALITPKGNEAIKKQLRFAIDEMNTSRVVKGKQKWAIKEPWITSFKRLSEDTAFQAIQVRYVRDLLSRARYFCEYFGLKSEMAFAFMFDAVSSHGKGWLTKKYKGNVEKRRELLRPRLAALEAMYGKGKVPEGDVLLAIADVLAATSSERWRDNVRRRKQWFVTGKHPRAAELQGLEPRPDVPYAASAPASASAAPSASTASSAAPKPAAVSHTSTISEAERLKRIAAAIHQAKTDGDPEARVAIVKTLEANGEHLESWFEGLVSDATFLGRRIRASSGKVDGVHRALLERLRRAERTLLDQHPGRTPEQLGKDLGIYEISGLRIPKKPTGKHAGVSFHCFGLAVDINHDSNPFVGNDTPKKVSPRYKEFMDNRSPRVIERAMQLLRGQKLDLDQPISGSVGAIWDVHHGASDALAEYLRLADDLGGARLQSLVAKAQAGGDSRTLAWWKNRLTSDRAVLPHWDFQNVKRPEKTGYMDLPRDLVLALTGAGLYWGGQYSGSKDIMHFDLRSGPVKRLAK